MKLSIINLGCILIFIAMESCNGDPQTGNNTRPDTSGQAYTKGTFGYDLHFLQQHDSIVSLQLPEGGARVLVSPKYQAKVFTSTASGDSGASFGWINYKAFEGPADLHMNAYGGENRFWLGPEGNIFSLFFRKGKEMVFGNWKTPAPFDTEPWTVTGRSAASVSMRKDMTLTNYAGSGFSLQANRTITLLDKATLASKLGASPGEGVAAVGYEAENTIINTGTAAWNEQTGMPCIWMLDMFNPAPATVIVVPYQTAVKDTGSNIATTDYFGAIPSDRIRYRDGILFFKADGKSRGKLGLGPARARDRAGSYDPTGHVLTIIRFDVDPAGRYLNQEWNTRKPPFNGDAVNAYNDGPLENGTQMGPFYELESVSPAAALPPGGRLAHHHAVFHFTGPEAALDKIAQKVLGVTLGAVRTAFEK